MFIQVVSSVKNIKCLRKRRSFFSLWETLEWKKSKNCDFAVSESRGSFFDAWTLLTLQHIADARCCIVPPEGFIPLCLYSCLLGLWLLTAGVFNFSRIVGCSTSRNHGFGLFFWWFLMHSCSCFSWAKMDEKILIVFPFVRDLTGVYVYLGDETCCMVQELAGSVMAGFLVAQLLNFLLWLWPIVA